MRTRALLALAAGGGLSTVGGVVADDLYNHGGSRSAGLTRLMRSVGVASQIALDYKLNRFRSGDPEELTRRSHERGALALLKLCRRNGGLYIKFGQHLAQLEYVIPEEYCGTLSSLLAACPHQPVGVIERVVARELGAPLDELFDDFSPEPVAAASLAQVHTAVLKETGQKLAIKVQHEGLKEASVADIFTVRLLVDAAHKLFPGFDFRWLAEETAENLPLELDFYHEGLNVQRCRRNLTHIDNATTPEVIWDHTTPNVLTMSFEEGVHIFEKGKIVQMGLSPKDVSQTLSRIFAEQIFVHGFVHCDPHGGNVLVRPDPRNRRKPQLVLLDHGLYRELSPQFRLDYAHLWHGLVTGDAAEIRDSAKALGADDSTYQLFAAMLTLRTWDRIVGSEVDQPSAIDRLDRRHEKDDSDELRGYVEQYFKEISGLLANMPRSLLLVLKTNDNLRSVDRALGAPLNTLAVTAETVARVIEEQEISDSHGSWVLTLRAKLHSLEMRMRITVLRILVSCSQLASKLRSQFGLS